MTKTDYRFTLTLMKMIKAKTTTRSMKMSRKQITYSMRKPEEKESDFYGVNFFKACIC